MSFTTENMSFNLPLKYIAKSTRNIYHLHVSNMTYQTDILPNVQMCQDSTLCVLNISTSKLLFLNLTLHEFSYTGENNTDSCDYAGVSAYDVGIYTHHIKTECVRPIISRTFTPRFKIVHVMENGDKLGQNIWSNIAFLRSHYPQLNDSIKLYSRYQGTIIVMYSFPDYGQLSFRINVQLSLCQDVPVNLEFCETGFTETYDNNFLWHLKEAKLHMEEWKE